MKKILILGASSDIGLSLLNNLKYKNYKIGAHCNSSFKRLNNAVNSKFHNIKIFKKNLRTEKDCRNLVSDYLNWSKGVDILIQLNGTVSKNKYWEQLGEKDWKNDIAVNLTAPFFTSQLVFKKMKKTGGKIIFTSTSSADKGGGRNSISYGVAKAGLMSLTKTMAREGGKFNILVNCIAPGFILTRLHTKKLKKNKKDINDRKKYNVLNQIGKPDQVSSLISYLISDDAKFITGEIIRVDGGDWL